MKISPPQTRPRQRDQDVQSATPDKATPQDDRQPLRRMIGYAPLRRMIGNNATPQDDRQRQRVPSAGQTTPDQRVRGGKERGKQGDKKWNNGEMTVHQTKQSLESLWILFYFIILFGNGRRQPYP